MGRYLFVILALSVIKHVSNAGGTPGVQGTSFDVQLISFIGMVLLRRSRIRLFILRDGRKRLEQLPVALQHALVKRRESSNFERTDVALSIGGGAIPLGVALYQLYLSPPGLMMLWFSTATLIVAILLMHYGALRGLPNISVPLAAPAISILLAWLLADPSQRLSLACSSGCLGILTGMDLLHLNDIQNLGRPTVTLGAGRSFDAIFLNQVAALLLS